jgi:hypothetical protein
MKEFFLRPQIYTIEGSKRETETPVASRPRTQALETGEKSDEKTLQCIAERRIR